MTRHIILLLITLPLLSNGQGSIKLQSLMAMSSPGDLQQAETRLQEFVGEMKLRRASSDAPFLKKVFRKTQREFLRTYTAYPNFSEIFRSGKYDCLTATSLYSIILSELSFNYRIIETNYHIFLLVKTSEGDILLETTDRFSGFVTRAGEIQQRIGTYRTGISADADNGLYRYQCDLYDEVSPGKLPGLLYYNQAVKAYNTGSLEECGQLLAKARSIYNSPRIQEFGSLFLKAVANSHLDNATKIRIFRQFKSGLTPSTVLASR